MVSTTDIAMPKVGSSATMSTDTSNKSTSNGTGTGNGTGFSSSPNKKKTAKKTNKSNKATSKHKHKLQQMFKLQPKYDAAIASSQKQLTLGWKGLFALVILSSCIVYRLSNDPKLLAGPFMLDADTKIKDNPQIRTLGQSLMETKIGSESTTSNLNYNDPSRPLASLTFQLNYKYGGYDPVENEIDATVFRITNFVMHALNAVLVGYLAHLLYKTLRFNSDCANAMVIQTSSSSPTKSSLLSLSDSSRGESFAVACAATALFAASPFNHSVAMYTYARSDIMGAMATFLYVILGLNRLLSTSYDEERTKFCFDMKMMTVLLFGLFSKQLVVVVPGAFLFLHLVLLELPWQWRQQQIQQLQKQMNSNNGAAGDSDDSDTATNTASSTGKEKIDCMANVLYSAVRTIYCHLLSLMTVGFYFIFRLVKFGRVTDLEMIDPHSLNYRCYVINQPYAWFRYALTMFYPKGIALDHNLIQNIWCKKDEMKFASIALFLLFVILLVRTFNIAKVENPSPSSSTTSTTPTTATSSSTGTDPMEVIILAGLGFYGLNILPSSVVVTTDVYCERRAYAAGAGIYCAFAICLFEIFARSTRAKASNKRGVRKSSSNKTSMIYAPVVATIVSYFMLTSLEINPTFYSNEALWREVVRQYPGSIRGMTNLGNAITQRVQDQLLSCNPDTHAMYDPSTCDAFDKASYDEAEGFYYALLKLRPKDAYAINGMARLKQLVGKNDEAIKYWRLAAENDPLLAAGAYKMIGTQLHKMRRLDEAIVEYNRAMKLAPNFSAELYNNLALAHLNSGEFSPGKKVFNEGMRRFPGDKLLLSNKHLFMGNGGGGRGHQRQASARGSQQDTIPKDATVISDSPDDPNYPIYLFYMALQHHNDKELDKAEELYRKHMELAKNPMPDAYNNLSILLSQAGKLSEGREIWTKGIAIDPKNEQLLKNKAYIFRSA